MTGEMSRRLILGWLRWTRKDGLMMVSFGNLLSMVRGNLTSWKTVLAPSAIPYSDTYPKPKELTKEGMKRIEDAFVAAVHRCKEAGCERIFYSRARH